MHLLDGISDSGSSGGHFRTYSLDVLICSQRASTCISIISVYLHSFYRFVLESDVAFMANNTVSPGPVARFMELPESPLLTLNMITPESWMVQAVRSPHDLDNIHLQEVS